MSEYQYYEFQAIDRKLTAAEMQALRALSSRATITPASFVNEYNYGDFRGSPEALMEKYFDAHVYVANWGTHRLMLRLPRRLLDENAAKPYCAGHLAKARRATKTSEFVILEWSAEEESGGDWEEGGGWLASLIPIRAELLGGDRSALYLGWLLGAQAGELDDDDVEPEVPPGLARLSASLERLAEFLRIDPALIEVAAEVMPAHEKEEDGGALRVWIAALPSTKKDEYLRRLVEGDDPHLRPELIQAFQRAGAAGRVGKRSAAPARRTVAALLATAKERGEANQRAAATREVKALAAREQKEARAKKKRLDALVKDETSAWRRVDALIAKTDHDDAVALLVDLRDLAAREGQSSAFMARLDALRSQHKTRQALLRRINKAGLRSPAGA